MEKQAEEGKRKVDFTKEEKTLDTIADVVLVIGIGVALLLLLFKCTYESSFGNSHGGDYNWPIIIQAITIGLSSLTAWAVLKVIVGISVNIGKIANKQDKN